MHPSRRWAAMNVIQTIRNYLELCRIQFAGFGILCVVGAMTVVGAELTLMQFLPLFAVHVLTIAWSFAHNDYCDYEIDRHGEDLSRRVIVRGDISRRSALIFATVIFATSLLVTTIAWPGLLPAGLLMMIAALVVLYNRLSKRFVGTDVLFATAGMLFVVLGAVSAIPNYDPTLIPALTWIVVAITFLDLLNFNAVLGGFKDLVSDKEQGCRTLAGKFTKVDSDGRLTTSAGFKIVTMSGTLLMIALIFLPFLVLPYPSTEWQIGAMAVLSVMTVFYTWKFVNVRQFDREAIGELAGKREFASNMLRLFMFVSWIGITWTLYLMAMGAAILVLFNIFIYGHPFRTPSAY